MAGRSHLNLRHDAAPTPIGSREGAQRKKEGGSRRDAEAQRCRRKSRSPREALKPPSPPRLCVSARMNHRGCAAREKGGGHDLRDNKDFASFAPSRETPFLSAPETLKAPARQE